MMNHLEVLGKIEQNLEKDSNALTLLVFGSVAKGDYHQNSDIDLMAIYQNFIPGYEFSTDYINNIKVGFSRWSLEKWRISLAKQPYRKYVFTTAQVLFDKTGKVHLWQEKIIDYFRKNIDIQERWNQYAVAYEAEKQRYGSGQSNIFNIYRDLDEEFSNRTLNF